MEQGPRRQDNRNMAAGAALLRFAIALTVLLLATVTVGCRKRPAGPGVGLESCLTDLTNVAAFAETPKGRAGLVSSYDRTGGNNDWAKLPPPGPDGLIEIASLKGPGCVKRIWMTNVFSDRWLFFFDGESSPRIQGSFRDIFGGVFPFREPLSDQVSGGYYCYVPLPYEKSLRICITNPKKPTPYFHIQYETYPAGTPVETFPEELSAEQGAHLGRVREAWRNNRSALAETVSSCGTPERVRLEPGGEAAWLDAHGPATLGAFTLRIVPPGGSGVAARFRLLRELVLRLTWDGAASPAVDVPLGDFFCNAFFTRRFAAGPLGCLDGAYVCRFPMPFAKSARGALVNQGAMPVDVEVAIRVDPGDAGNARFFHAAWNGSVSRGVPHTVLATEAPGHLVGCYLSAIGMDGTWTILEGDEAFYIDGEPTASLHGTGLEDYFNGAWYYSGLFDLPLHGLLEKGSIRTDQYRFHLPDRIGFDRSLRFTFEFGDQNRARGYMSSMAYWYSESPTHRHSPLPPAASRIPPRDPFEAANLMGRLFELERAGCHSEAAERCEEFSEKYAKSEFGGVLKLRAASYRERAVGFEGVKETLAALAQNESDAVAAGQARDLLWLHESRTNALLGVHSQAKYRVFLDGESVGQGESPKRLDVKRVGAKAGSHVIAAEAVATGPGSFISICLKMQGTNLCSGSSWECRRDKPADWPAVTGDSGWKPLGKGCALLPTMYNMFFQPNAYVDMQSRRQAVSLWAGYSRQPIYAKLYLRKRFVMPSGDGL